MKWYIVFILWYLIFLLEKALKIDFEFIVLSALALIIAKVETK